MTVKEYRFVFGRHFCFAHHARFERQSVFHRPQPIGQRPVPSGIRFCGSFSRSCKMILSNLGRVGCRGEPRRGGSFCRAAMTSTIVVRGKRRLAGQQRIQHAAQGIQDRSGW